MPSFKDLMPDVRLELHLYSNTKDENLRSLLVQSCHFPEIARLYPDNKEASLKDRVIAACPYEWSLALKELFADEFIGQGRTTIPKVRSTYDLVDLSLAWSSTKQGSHFWRDVAHGLRTDVAHGRKTDVAPGWRTDVT